MVARHQVTCLAAYTHECMSTVASMGNMRGGTGGDARILQCGGFCSTGVRRPARMKRLFGDRRHRDAS